MAKLQKIIVGASGEYYVASYLSGMGVVVAITRGGTPTTDLIVTSARGGRAVSIQVKTSAHPHVVYKRLAQKNYWTWDTPFKAKDFADRSHWYVFVALNGWPASGNMPDIFFVPSKVVARNITLQFERGDTRPMFEMPDAVAEQYRGQTGCQHLLALLDK